MNPATSATATSTVRRTAYGVFSQFWNLVNSDDPGVQAQALDLLNAGVVIKITRIGRLKNERALDYAKRWSRKFGQLGNPHLSHQLSLTEDGDDKGAATIVLECVYRNSDGNIKAVRHSEQEPTDLKSIMVHRVRLEEDGRIISWTVMIEDEDLLDLVV